MPIAISDDHSTLAATVAEFLAKHDARAANRQLLEADAETLPPFWRDAAALGWLGLHLAEEFGGSGYELADLVIVVEQLGRAVAPGPFVPTMIASAVIAACGSDACKARYLPGLADGTRIGAVALDAELTAEWSAVGDTVHGRADAAVAIGLADVLLLPGGDDVVVVDVSAPGIDVEVPRNIDPSRRAGRVHLSGAPAEILRGARQTFVDLARLLFAAEAMGIAQECTDAAVGYAKVREQFGRPIATFQAVKHHCANMALAAELSTAAVWDAARAAELGGEQLSYASAIAATLAVPAAVDNAQLNIQVHGGIGYTWEHDAHLLVRRALAIASLVDAGVAAGTVHALARQGVARSRSIGLPPEAETIRNDVRDFVDRVRSLDREAQLAAMLEEGYAVPHWPRPWGREAGAIEQIVIDEEFAAAGIARPRYPITGWCVLTVVQFGTEAQVARYVDAALRQEIIWCQLFSEPDAGSDAAAIKTRATRVDGGWRVSGQKVWTSGAHQAAFGLATVRTNPDVPKHKGITMMVIDMSADGVIIRPLRQLSGNAEFSEVFLDDVFVPDDDVVGPVDGGWNVARATLGLESLSIAGGDGDVPPTTEVIDAFDAHPHRLPGGETRLGRYLAQVQATELMHLRSAERAVTGKGPGPEGAMTKLAFSESHLEAAALLAVLAGPELAYLEGPGALAASTALGVRVWTVAGGTSEIKRNQIGERLLGLPRDPLLS